MSALPGLRGHVGRALTLFVLVGALVWSYWPTLVELEWNWSTSPQYSHGYLVPLLGAGMLWWRRDGLRKVSPRTNWWGLGLLVLAGAMRLGGSHFYYGWFESMSLVVCLAGLCLLLGGWGFLRWALPGVGFLVFMVPLPYRLERSLAWPLQRMATVSSGYVLQTAGVPAIAEGNVLLLKDEFPLEVAQACSGLRMLLSFLALSSAVALVAQRVWWERCLVLLSGVPIALASNVLRITATGLLVPWLGGEQARVFFHDVSGYLMMPVALGMLLLELVLLSRLWIEVEAESTVPVGVRSDLKGTGMGSGRLRSARPI